MKSLEIPIQLIIPTHTMKTIDTRALINSGVDISYIDWQFICENKLPTTKLTKSIHIRNIDASPNKKGDIQFSCNLFINIEGIAQQINFHVMSLGSTNILLGLHWLKATNPTIDWKKQVISINESINESKLLYFTFISNTTQYNSSYPRKTPQLPQHINVHIIHDAHLYNYLHEETKSQYLWWALDNWTIHHIIYYGSKFIPAGSPVIARLTATTKLAMAAKAAKPKVTLPKEYSKFSSVFSKEVTGHIPPSCPYDHEINLNESFTPKIGKVYPLFPNKRKAGKIHLSSSPQAFPFFFVKKKDGGLWPCQDYHYLNEHTVWDVYPLSLISNLVDKLQGAEVFTKFDMQWEYNNVCVKDGHKWKATFVIHKGLFKPIVMFFGLMNSSATFQ